MFCLRILFDEVMLLRHVKHRTETETRAKFDNERWLVTLEELESFSDLLLLVEYLVEIFRLFDFGPQWGNSSRRWRETSLLKYFAFYGSIYKSWTPTMPSNGFKIRSWVFCVVSLCGKLSLLAFASSGLDLSGPAVQIECWDFKINQELRLNLRDIKSI